MGKIICLMGKSASGKDSIFKDLLKRKEWRLKTIVPYTTRPQREGETNGVEYYFVGDGEMESLTRQGKVIECRTYHTVAGAWHYFTVDDGQIQTEESKDHSILIGTLEVYEALRTYYGADRVLPVYVALDDGVRLMRAITREMEEQQPRYEELCRRFLADAEDFSKAHLEKAGIERIFENKALHACVDEISAYLSLAL